MNSKNLNRIELFNQIKSLSMPDFPNLHVLSKSFFNELFLKSYENKNIYTVLYGDINGLRKLNDEIGFKNADLAIEKLLKIILYYLPKNTISFRVGGDEFCFVIPELSTSQTRELTKNIHENLLSEPEVHGLDISFGCCDSTEFDNIREMYSFAENKVVLKKISHLNLDEYANNLTDYNDKLDKFIDYTIKTYISHFRFSPNRNFTRQDLETLSYPILNSITNLINSESKFVNNKKDNTDLCDKNIPRISLRTLETLYNLVIRSDIDSESLSNISNEDLESIKNSLSVDSITNAYNAVYRDHYILQELKKNDVPIQILLAESLGIKISNSVLTHTGTDKKIKYTFDNLLKLINDFIPENSNIELIPIHAGGGTFEFIIKNNTDIISYDFLKDSLHKMSLDNNNFYVLGILGNCFDMSEYDQVYSKLNTICEIKKNRIKRKQSYFLTPEAIQLIDVSLYSLVNYFKTQSQNLGIYNEKEKMTFTKKIMTSLINNFNELNLINEKDLKNKGDSQSDER